MIALLETLGDYTVAGLWLARALMVSGGVLMICALIAFWRMVRA